MGFGAEAEKKRLEALGIEAPSGLADAARPQKQKAKNPYTLKAGGVTASLAAKAIADSAPKPIKRTAEEQAAFDEEHGESLITAKRRK
jgi:hypothetical protein